MKIIFVYNADSGFMNTLLDIGHKALSPDSYQCSLCSITHGLFEEKREWKKYRENSGHELIFLHRNEYETTYQTKQEYPVVLIEKEPQRHEVVISKHELDQMKDLSAIIRRLERV